MEALTTMGPVIRYEGTNARGEPSSPRVDLLAVGQLLDRAALAVAELQIARRAAGIHPGPAPEILERDLTGALRQIRALRCRRKRRMRWVRERD
jgi:hypothetical protein